MDAIIEILELFAERKILVVGDLMVDRYIHGGASRLSPEAPVPVVLMNHQHDALGGAANVARNLVSLGAKCELAGFVGIDEAADALRSLCAEIEVGTSAVIGVPRFPTTCKTRILAENHQLLRVDREETSERPGEAYDELFTSIHKLIFSEGFNAIIVSDYAKGLTSPAFMARLWRLADEREIPVYVDPKGTDFEKYRGAALIKPNRAEMASFARRWGWPTWDLVGAAKELRVAADVRYVALTLGEGGMVVVSNEKETLVPTRAREVYDVTGAGDTVMAALVLGIASGLEIEQAADIANHAAAIVVARVGSSAVEAGDLAHSINSDSGDSLGRKVCSLKNLTWLVGRWREEGKKIVFTNGCFDIIHAGHTSLLQEAKRHGDRLVVGLNSDASITGLKGPLRPLIGLEQRAAVLSALEAVDAIVVFEEDTPQSVIETLQPDVIVKGGDYEKSNIVGADLVERRGGRVVIIPITNQVSTSKIAEALQKL